MNVRREWLEDLLAITGPVLETLDRRELKQKLPLGFHPDRAEFAPLEAFGRSMLGLAPWLEADSGKLDPEERELQAAFRAKALRCVENAVTPDSPDYMLFNRDGQPLVDTAFLAHAVLRAPTALAAAMKEPVRRALADAFRASRVIVPYNCNWIFFSAMVEAGLRALGEDWDQTRVLYALRTFQHWYVGDGAYGDGPMFHWDYYNSFVIQPMYTDLVNELAPEHPEIAEMREEVNRRAARYASVLERMIGPDGSWPVFGRSVCYRFGCFQMLAQAALQHRLEKHLTPASVRCGLTAAIRRVMGAKTMFDENGWLLPGIIGRQEELAEGYINIGSLYLCSAVFLPLGLPPEDPFWSAPDEDWTGKKIWSGAPSVIDHAAD